jgi:PKD repeat protein
MKRIITTLSIFIFLFSTAAAQTAHPFELGFNAGAAWLKSDVKKEKLGAGLGLTFGQTYCMNNTSPLLWGWRFRYLNANTYGQDSKKSYGIANNSVLNGDADTLLDYYHHDAYVYQNYKTHIDEVSVEVLLGINSIRERTNLYPYIFGGAGLTKAVARTNQLDDNNQRYDYLHTIDTTGSSGSSDVLSQLKNINDDSYETLADGNRRPRWKFMPSFGVGLGFEVVKGFSIGLEHKMTWAFNDVLDGQQWSSTNSTTGTNDMYHYTSFWLKFSFGRGAKGSHTTTNTNTTNVSNYTNTAPAPVVAFTTPSSSPFNAASVNMSVEGTVANINSVSNMSISQNGIPVNGFAWNSDTHIFIYPASLQSGANTFIVTATNAAGSVTASATVIYNQPVVTPDAAPVVNIAFPASDPYTTNRSGITVSGTVLNIGSKSQMQVMMNGAAVSSFNYNASTHEFSLNASLIQGANTVVVSASNSAGNDSRSITLIYKKEAAAAVTPPPVITIVDPASNPFSTAISPTNVDAVIQNVTAAGQIQVLLNGGPVPASRLYYNAGSHHLTFNIPLVQGANTVVISASNVGGNDSKTQTIIYTEQVQVPAPVVTITNPSANPFTTSFASSNVAASVMNITSAGQISVLLNGNPVPAGALHYNAASHQLTFGVSLIAGANTVVVSASNAGGSDSKTITIIYSQPVVIAPPVVTITSPNANPFAAAASTVTITATVSNVSSAAQITVSQNGTATTAFAFNAATQQLSMAATLIPGSNTITITAANASGNDSKTETINYTVPVLPPVVSFITPASGTATSSAAIFAIAAKAMNVLTAGQISVKVNGTPVTGFIFLPMIRKISFNANLIPGNNSIVITATNSAGSDSKTATITYVKTAEAITIPTNPDTAINLGRPGGAGAVSHHPPAGGTPAAIETEPPMITLVDPAATPFSTTNATYTVKVKVMHVTVASAISIMQNGVNVTGFAFDAATNMLSIPLTLVTGPNTVMITAVNNMGEKRAKVVVTRE